MFEPQATIRLMKGVPLDNTYRNTLYFDNLTDQFDHFVNTYAYKVFNNQTYQRYAKNKLRIKEFPGNLYEYNYLAFKNNNDYNQKVFYCFITSVEYISENTTEVTYELDYIQTYFFDYRLGMCFVEREHSVTDKIGENLVPEGLDCGELVGDNPTIIDELRELDMCIASTSYTVDGNVVDTDGEIYSGLFSGQRLTHFPMNAEGVKSLQDFLGTLTEKAKSDGITSLFLVSRHIANLSNEVVQQTVHRVSRNYGIKKTNGKLPNNNKLFTSPYCVLYVTNWQGDCAIYPYEYFQPEYDALGNITNDECVFCFFGDYSPLPSVILYPIKYKGVLHNYDEKLTLTGYPQLSFNIDTFKAYIAQNSGKIVAQGVGMFLDTAAGASKALSMSNIKPDRAASMGIDTAVNTAKNITNTIGAYRDLSVKPPQSVGGVSISLALASEQLLNFQFIHKHIRSEYVDIIDGYFDMYGYATHKVKIPNRDSRPYWNYVKTTGCVLLGTSGCPSEVAKAICSIYDNGITFWHNKVDGRFYVGDYSKNNTVNGGE